MDQRPNQLALQCFEDRILRTQAMLIGPHVASGEAIIADGGGEAYEQNL